MAERNAKASLACQEPPEVASDRQGASSRQVWHMSQLSSTMRASVTLCSDYIGAVICAMRSSVILSRAYIGAVFCPMRSYVAYYNNAVLCHAVLWRAV